MVDNKKENKKKRLLMLLLLLLFLLITITAVGVSVSAIWFRDSTPVLAPDYAPKQLEENAEPIGDDGDEKLSQPEGGEDRRYRHICFSPNRRLQHDKSLDCSALCFRRRRSGILPEKTDLW